MAQDCPRCGLVNPPGAQRCDCGYDFASRRVGVPYAGAGEAAGRLGSPSMIEYIVCVVLPLVGLILGLVARGQGLRTAGSRMILISGVLFAICNGPLLLAILMGAFRALD